MAAAAVLPEPRDVGTALRGLRAVKTAEELATLRRAIAVCDAGQAAARTAVRAGVTELTAWNEIAGAMEAAAGERLPLLCDLVSGPRSAEIGGYPDDRVIERRRPRDLRPRAPDRRHVRRLLLDHRRRRAAGRRP